MLVAGMCLWNCTESVKVLNLQGKCIFASGSPFGPVTYEGKTYTIGQVWPCQPLSTVTHIGILTAWLNQAGFSSDMSCNLATSIWVSPLGNLWFGMVEKKRKRPIMKQFLLTELACLPETVLRDFFFSIQATCWCLCSPTIVTSFLAWVLGALSLEPSGYMMTCSLQLVKLLSFRPFFLSVVVFTFFGGVLLQIVVWDFPGIDLFLSFLRTQQALWVNQFLVVTFEQRSH